jgi:hypothetical protein
MISGIELLHRIRKGQFTLGRLRIQGHATSAIWNAELSEVFRHDENGSSKSCYLHQNR